ncbi:MAG: hypothetical protein FD167_1176 [bacterium]|nr:MAG: hypothetical protein FD167_1176 [bacterium]
MLNNNHHSNVLKTLLLISFILCNCFLVISQTSPQKVSKKDEKPIRDTIRIDKVNPEEFARNRANPKPFRKNVVSKIISSRSVKPNSTKSNGTETVEEEIASLGFTLWKLRKSEKDDTYRISEIIGAEKEGELTPERVEGKAVVENGALLRFVVELPTKGYLYVFDQEVYLDGSHSAPYLMYPIKGINNLEDNNLIEPNQPIYLPRQKESYCFRLSRGKEGKIMSEIYTFLITPQPLTLNAIECIRKGENSKGETIVHCQPREVKKDEFDFETKLKEWSAYTEASEFNLKDPNHQRYKTMDKAEIQSLNNKASKLTIQDPPPQKVYAIARKPTEPYMVSIPIYINSK